MTAVALASLRYATALKSILLRVYDAFRHAEVGLKQGKTR